MSIDSFPPKGYYPDPGLPNRRSNGELDSDIFSTPSLEFVRTFFPKPWEELVQAASTGESGHFESVYKKYGLDWYLPSDPKITPDVVKQGVLDLEELQRSVSESRRDTAPVVPYGVTADAALRGLYLR